MELLANVSIGGRSDAPTHETEGLGSSLALLMDQLAYGAVVINMQAQVLYANQVARQELARQRALGLRDNLLYARTEDNAQLLKNSLGKAGYGQRSLITLSTGAGLPLPLAVIPLKTEAAAQPLKAALVFARASVCESLMLCFFARAHSLTVTEEHVLGILCDGYSAPEIASRMNVAVSTIRSHVRSLCAKTRSSGVRELVNRVAVLPPVAPALWCEPVH